MADSVAEFQPLLGLLLTRERHASGSLAKSVRCKRKRITANKSKRLPWARGREGEGLGSERRGLIDDLVMGIAVSWKVTQTDTFLPR